MSILPPPDPDYRRWPLYWLAMFEVAIESGDLATAAHIQGELKALGLRVEPLPPWSRREPADVSL
jgi:hypothetical protein